MSTNADKEKMAQIVAAKASFRADQGSKTWEQRVKTIARMNAADKLAMAAMMNSMKRKHWRASPAKNHRNSAPVLEFIKLVARLERSDSRATPAAYTRARRELPRLNYPLECDPMLHTEDEGGDG